MWDELATGTVGYCIIHSLVPRLSKKGGGGRESLVSTVFRERTNLPRIKRQVMSIYDATFIIVNTDQLSGAGNALFYWPQKTPWSVSV